MRTTIAILLVLLASPAGAQTRRTTRTTTLTTTPPASTQTLAVTGGGLDEATRRQIIEAVDEARKALFRLKEARNARCESVKERADLAAEQIDAKLERILLVLEKQPTFVHPVVVTETVETPEEQGPAWLLADEVARLSQAVASESFAEDQLRVLRLGFTGVPILVNDAKDLLARFNFSEDKLKALQVMVPYLYDRQNAFQLLDAFTFSDDKAEAQRILAR